ncbi:hypothetical protein N7468_001457 [Penicillium chermesinum]|uniref:Uncharacterized protein n=1 Tax=Penicillium chermesinum TaxID=63820 RepID=A0A9W9TYN7_9EURO|nr:uncharacterized protein N7468_001457 [Penicillium chermesinum]KAJ5246474.1 hypothetical protein N7468_001457 [Penicillium chermesinum]
MYVKPPMEHVDILILTIFQKPDYQTIADRLGISRHAAHQRFYTLRNYFKSLDGNNNAGAAGSGGPSSSATQRTTRSSQSGPVRTTTGATAEKESVDLTGEHQEGSSVKDDDYYDSDEDDEEDDYEY